MMVCGEGLLTRVAKESLSDSLTLSRDLEDTSATLKTAAGRGPQPRGRTFPAVQETQG